MFKDAPILILNEAAPSGGRRKKGGIVEPSGWQRAGVYATLLCIPLAAVAVPEKV